MISWVVLTIFVILVYKDYQPLTVIMSDLDRGIMKFKGADTPLAIGISATLVLGGIAFLVIWAMQNAYVS